MSAKTATAPAVDQQRLVRRFRPSRRLDFERLVRCHCGQDNLTVIDHRAPWYEPTARKEWRYEVTCDTCLQCDCAGYVNRADLLAAYSGNVQGHGPQPEPDQSP